MNAPPLALIFHSDLLARSSRHGTLWNTGRRFARSAGRLSTCSRTNVQKRWLTCMDGSFLSFFSPPAEQDPERGLRSPRSDRGAGTERCGGRPARGAAGATELDRPCRRGSAAGSDVPCGGVGWLTECGTRRLAGAWSWSADYGRRDGRATLGARSLLMQPA